MPLSPIPYTYVPNPPGNLNNAGCVDWNNKIGYFFSGDFYSFNLFSRAQITHIPGGTAFPNINVEVGFRTISVGTIDGLIYSAGLSSLTNPLISGYNPLTGAAVKTYIDNPQLLGSVGNFCATDFGGDNIAMCCSLNAGQGGGSGGSIFGVNMDTGLSLGSPVNVSEILTSVGPGNVWISRGISGKAYAVSLGQYLGVPQTMGIYEVSFTQTSFGITRIGGHVAADFGFGSALSLIATCALDESDGNIVCFVQAGSSNAICKFSSIDGHIIWQTNFGESVYLDECSIKHGQLEFVNLLNIAVINLATGGITNIPITSTGSTDRAYYNDSLDFLVVNSNNNSGANPQWVTFGPPPSPLVLGGGVIRLRG